MRNKYANLTVSEGSTYIEGHFYKRYDMHCPAMGTAEKNYYREKCLSRQDDARMVCCDEVVCAAGGQIKKEWHRNQAQHTNAVRKKRHNGRVNVIPTDINTAI